MRPECWAGFPLPLTLRGNDEFTDIGLIPAGATRAYHALAAALTGRLDPTPDVAAAGAWKVGPRWGAEIQEALADR